MSERAAPAARGAPGHPARRRQAGRRRRSTTDSGARSAATHMGDCAERIAEKLRRLARGAGRVRARAATRRRSPRSRRGALRRRDRAGRGRRAEGRRPSSTRDEPPARRHLARGAGQAAPGLPSLTARVTAGNAPGLTDGAAALVVASGRRVARARPDAAGARHRLRHGGARAGDDLRRAAAGDRRSCWRRPGRRSTTTT